jgi:signal transduction histidine kinase
MTPLGAGSESAAEERLVMMVHDLRTPLTVISGFCELLDRQRDRLTEEQKDEYLRRISEAAQELRQILDDEREERLGAG